MIIGVLAILKSGKGYLPLDPNYPEDRLKQIVSNAKIKFYIMVCEKDGELSQKKEKAQNKIEAIEKYIRLTCEKV